MIYLNKTKNRIRDDDRPKHSAENTIDHKADTTNEVDESYLS